MMNYWQHWDWLCHIVANGNAAVLRSYVHNPLNFVRHTADDFDNKRWLDWAAVSRLWFFIHFEAGEYGGQGGNFCLKLEKNLVPPQTQRGSGQFFRASRSMQETLVMGRRRKKGVLDGEFLASGIVSGAVADVC